MFDFIFVGKNFVIKFDYLMIFKIFVSGNEMVYKC